MIFTIYPFLKLKEYNNFLSNKIVKKYEIEKIDEKYFYDINYFKKNLHNKFINNQLNKNEYLQIEYFQTKYPEDNYFQEMANKIPYNKNKCNIKFVRKNRIIEEEYDTIDLNNNVKKLQQFDWVGGP